MRIFQVQTQSSCDWRNFKSKKEAKNYALALAEEVKDDEEKHEIACLLCDGSSLDDFSPNYLIDAFLVETENGKIVFKNFPHVQKNAGKVKLFWG